MLLLWQLAVFCCGSWRFFVVAVGGFLLWQLAVFCCGSWRFFVVAVGGFLLWQLAVFRCGSWHIYYKKHKTGPILIPLWFVRDLMVVVLFTPIIYGLVKRFNLLPVLLLAFCYISSIRIQIPGFTVTTKNIIYDLQPHTFIGNPIKVPFRITERTFQSTERTFRNMEWTFRSLERNFSLTP